MSVPNHKKSSNGHAPKAIKASKRRAAFYDLDGTLVDLNLVHAAIFTLANVGEWSGRVSYLLGFAARIPRLYVAEQRDRRLLNTVLFEAFKGVSRDRLFSLGEEYCERILISHLFPRAVELIEANREAGIEPVLVTGSPDFIVAPLARHLGIAEFAANRFVFSRGRATGRLAEPVMAGDEKAVWCADYAASHDIELDGLLGLRRLALRHLVSRRARASRRGQPRPQIARRRSQPAMAGDSFRAGGECRATPRPGTQPRQRRIDARIGWRGLKQNSRN